MPWNNTSRRYDKSPRFPTYKSRENRLRFGKDKKLQYKVESGYDTVKKIAIIDETNISTVMVLVNDALSQGWVITQDITVYWNNGKTKYIAVLGKKE